MANLLIISHTEHYYSDGAYYGWGATVQEIDYLATLFSQVRHVAWLYDGTPQNSSLPYSADNVTLVPVSASGGNTFTSKLGILSALPLYVRTLLREMRSADVVHVRCPASISLIAIVLLTFLRKPSYRWVKYAGNWRPARSPLSYALQRWWLNRNLHRGAVTINGRWEGQPGHVFSFLNPCLSKEELATARSSAEVKRISKPVRLVFVGYLGESKGVSRLLHITQRLVRELPEVRLDVVGDSPARAEYEALARSLGIAGHITFHGWKPRTELGEIYQKAHIMIFPTDSEGWPKVVSEAMAYGIVPLVGSVSSIPQILEETKAGIAIDPYDTHAFAEAALRCIREPEAWTRMSTAGLESAWKFTYETYLMNVSNVFQKVWGVTLASNSTNKSEVTHILHDHPKSSTDIEIGHVQT